MTPECERVMDHLGGPLPPELATHAASCEDCRAITSGFGALDAAPPVATPQTTPGMQSARRRTLEELAATPVATPWWRELLVLLATYGVVVVGGLIALGRKGIVLNSASPVVVVGLAILILGLVGGGAYVALAPTRHRFRWAPVAVGAALIAVLQLVGGSGNAPVRGFLSGLMGCLTSELVLSIPPMILALVLLCRSAFQPVRAFAAGLSAAGVSLFVLHLHCPDGTVEHIALGHIAPWLLLSWVALFLRSRLPTRSYAP
jgi:hypothetical protein